MLGVLELADRDEVLDLHNTRGCPGSMFGFFPLRPGADITAKRHFTAGRLHFNVSGIGFRIAFQCVFDFDLHVYGANFRRYADLIDDPLNAF